MADDVGAGTGPGAQRLWGGRFEGGPSEAMAALSLSVHFDWLERFRWDKSRPDRRAGEIKHGVRMCFFDPSGKRVATAAGISGGPTPKLRLHLADDAPAGVWHVQACSVGELDRIPDDPADFTLPDDKRCVRPLLEYAFEVKGR